MQKDGRVDIRAFTFCVLSHLQTAIHRRDVFTHPSWRYADPRSNLLSDAEWEATRQIVCRILALPSDGAGQGGRNAGTAGVLVLEDYSVKVRSHLACGK